MWKWIDFGFFLFLYFVLMKAAAMKWVSGGKCICFIDFLPPKLSENPVVRHVAARRLYLLPQCYRAASRVVSIRQKLLPHPNYTKLLVTEKTKTRTRKVTLLKMFCQQTRFNRYKKIMFTKPWQGKTFPFLSPSFFALFFSFKRVNLLNDFFIFCKCLSVFMFVNVLVWCLY